LKLRVPVLLMGMLLDEGTTPAVTATAEMSWGVPVQLDVVKRL
jgi:hypothetical protein